MKLILYGNDAVDYCSEVHHAKSIRALGHSVELLNEQKISTNEVLEKSLQSDGLIWIHSHGFINKGTISMTDVLNILKEKKIPTIAYHLDLYMGIPTRWQEYQTSAYMNNLQHFFTVDKFMADWLNNNSQTKGHYLPAGVFHEECYALDLPKKYDVVFVGSKGYHPEWSYRPKLINWLRSTYENRFFHFGGDGLGVVRGHELNKVYSQTKVVIGDTFSPNFDYPYYFSDRMQETLGRNGFMIFPHITGVRDNYTQDELICYEFNDFVDLKNKIDYYLTHDAEREKIRKAGFERTKKDHTYLKRWETILKTLAS